MDQLDVGEGAILRGRALENAAVTWVMEYERRQGREPVDRRGRGFPADIESSGRIIEIKSTATRFRGWYLSLQPIQLERAKSDGAFFLYVVENVGSGQDLGQITLRILAGDHLRRLAAAAVARTSYEVGWPTADYDATPVEAMPPSLPEPGA